MKQRANSADFTVNPPGNLTTAGTNEINVTSSKVTIAGRPGYSGSPAVPVKYNVWVGELTYSLTYNLTSDSGTGRVTDNNSPYVIGSSVTVKQYSGPTPNSKIFLY